MRGLEVDPGGWIHLWQAGGFVLAEPRLGIAAGEGRG